MMHNRRAQLSHVVLLLALLDVACSSSDSPSSNGSSSDARGIGGLQNYGYAGNVSYGGYSAFAGQPWGGDLGQTGGSSSSTSAGTGGLNQTSSGGTTQVATTATGGMTTGGAATGGRSSGVGGATTGGQSTNAGGAGTGGRSSTSGGGNTGGTVTLGGSSATGGRANTGGTNATGGTSVTGGASTTGGASSTAGAAAFNWGTVAYNPTGGSTVNHQGHNTGGACLASCHSHNFQAGGTVYQANGTTTAGNVQVGVIMNGTLYSAYSGSQGNFFFPISGTLNWSTAQIAIRTATGTAIHPATSGLSGNCNSCHNSANRIVVP